MIPALSMAPATFSLPYRADRNYVHSADIFQAFTELARERFAPGAYLKSLVLRHKASRQLRASFAAEPDPIGTFSLQAGEQEVRGALVETDASIGRRVPYDESRAVAAVVAAVDSAAFISPVPGYTAFEHLLVAMKVAGGDADREAWLCQVALLGPLLESVPLAVTVTRRLRLFHRFAIAQGGTDIGSACATWRFPQ